MNKKEVITLLKDYEEDMEVDLYIKVYEPTGYYTLILKIEKIDREGIHTSAI